jgi:hypothetical protein
MTRQQVLDLYFLDARGKLLDIAAFLDRLERASGEADFRLPAFKAALLELVKDSPEHAQKILLTLSDPTTEPIASTKTQSAVGAWPLPSKI